MVRAAKLHQYKAAAMTPGDLSGAFNTTVVYALQKPLFFIDF
jgi:hypothetical protein